MLRIVNELTGPALNWAVDYAKGTTALPHLLTHPKAEGLPPRAMLPYEFDLLYDIKYWAQAEDILTGREGVQCSDATPSDLCKLANELGYTLSPFAPDYSIDWNLGGPVVDRAHLTTAWNEQGTLCTATSADKFGDSREGTGTSLLEAGLRAFIISRVGLALHIPDELLT